jgi:hypothetical protein
MAAYKAFEGAAAEAVGLAALEYIHVHKTARLLQAAGVHPRAQKMVWLLEAAAFVGGGG